MSPSCGCAVIICVHGSVSIPFTALPDGSSIKHRGKQRALSGFGTHAATLTCKIYGVFSRSSVDLLPAWGDYVKIWVCVYIQFVTFSSSVWAYVLLQQTCIHLADALSNFYCIQMILSIGICFLGIKPMTLALLALWTTLKASEASWWNGSSDRYFLLYCAVHPSLTKKKV